MLTNYLYIAAGGAIGSMLRYAMQSVVQARFGGRFPLGTLAVNVLGCFVAGFLFAAISGPFPLRNELRLAIMVGILGGFTTFSAFGIETIQLANTRHFSLALANIALSVTVGLAAVWIGYRSSQWLLGTA